MEAVDALATAGLEAGRRRRVREMAGLVVPNTTSVKADIGAGPIIVGYRRRRRCLTGMSAAIAGPAIAANATLARRNFFMTRPPSSPILVEYLTLRVSISLSPFSNIQKLMLSSFAPIFLRLPLHGWRFGVLEFEPVRRPTRPTARPSRFETIPSSPILQACWNTRAPSEVLQEAQTKAAIARRSHTLSMISTFRSAISVVCHPQTYAPAHSSPRSSVSLGRWRHGKNRFLQREAGVRASWFITGRW